MCSEDQAPEKRQAEVLRTVMMADIVGSTAMYERLGDRRARELVKTGLETMTSAVTRHGGRVIKSLGDGILACFEGAGAGPAAMEISERVTELLLQARVGVHHGSLIEEDSDIFGDTVNTAARLASAARLSEVLVSKIVWGQLPEDLRERGRSIPSISVKGKRDPVEVYSILPMACETLQTLRDSESGQIGDAAGTQIELRMEEESWRLDGPGSLLIGRGKDCDLRVDHEQTSRAHLRIFYRAPAFMLEDTSTNGTTVLQDNGAPVLIHRRETVLFGRGQIYAGSTPGVAGSRPIEYHIQ